MPFPEVADRCPECGSACPAGILLCPACILTDPPSHDEADDHAESGRIGTYVLLEEIARGGMGVVYRARQHGLNRIVALKVLPGAAFASKSFRGRFQLEAETAARLKHPGIVAVHEIGQWLGQPFLSMDFIDGPSLASRLAEGRMPNEFAAHILREVARAVDHAHGQGVAHRDLKPSNILLTPDNRPVLTDFGLACFLDLEAREPLTQDLMGSPPYLPPERMIAGASGNPVLEDVYGLGAVLYHCLTGRPPFMADTLPALLSAVANNEPVAPRRLNPSVPLDLETICLKCLEKSPSARYAGASEVADELDRFLRGDPIIARPLSPTAHCFRAIRKKPMLASLVFALLATITSGTLVSLQGWRSAASSAADSRAVAEKRRVDLYSANLSAASAAMETGNRNQARELLLRCLPADRETDLRGCEWFLIHHLLQGQEEFSLKAHDHIVTALAWHPSGEFLLSGAHDGSLKSWTWTKDHGVVADREILPSGNGHIQQIEWLDDGSAYLVAEGDFIRCRKPGENATLSPLWEIPGSRFSRAPLGRTLAVTTAGRFFYEPQGRISLWQLDADITRPPELRRTLPTPARAVAISPDSRWLAIGLPKHGHHDEEGDLELLDLSTREAAPRHLETSGAVLTLGFSPDSKHLVATTQSAKPRIHGFNVASGKELQLPLAHSGRVWAAEFAKDSSSVLTTSSDRSLAQVFLDGRTAQPLPLAHDNEIWAAAIHPSGKEVGTGDKDGILKIHSLPLPLPPVAAFPRHPHFRYLRPVFSPNSSMLYMCEASPTWKIVAWQPGNEGTQPTPYKFYPECLDTKGNAVWREAESRQMFHLGAANKPTTLEFPPESCPEVPGMHNQGGSHDRRHVYQFSSTGHAATVDLASGEIRSTGDFCKSSTNASALSPGGRYLVAATWDELIIHDFHAGQTTRLSNDHHWAKTIAFSPDGSLMASGGNDGYILLRRPPDFDVIGKLSGHLSEVSGLAFSPDGRTLVSSEIGSGLRFWRLDTLREVMRLPLTEVCENLVFSPDGQSLAVATCPPASPPTAGQVVVIPCPRDRSAIMPQSPNP